MKPQKIPYLTIALSMLTIACSLYVNFLISGTLFGKIKYFELEPYGGITFEHLWNWELWRLFVSQLIHFKQPHMFFNVLSLFLLGLILEKYIGPIRFFILWFISGVCGTLVATLTVEPPWNLGTGASQAVMGVAAFGAFLFWKKIDTTLRLKVVIGISVLPALIIDLIYAGHPKLGHVAGFMTGWAISAAFLHKSKSTKNSKHDKLHFQ